MANKKNTVKYILCGILVLACAAFTTMGVIALVKEIAKDTKVRKEIEASVDAEYDVINYNSTNQTTDPNAEPFTLEDHRRGVLNEVPDYIANRGIILRGGEYRESGQTYRAGAHDTSHWWYCEYVTDCNLVIEGTDAEFETFVNGLGDEVEFPAGGPGYPDFYNGVVIFEHYPTDDHTIYIYRTQYFRRDLSDGRLAIPASQDFTRPVFYDPSGRYIFYTNYGINKCEDILLKFLEPVMTRVEVTYPGETTPLFASDIVNPDVLQSYIDAMHELSAEEIDKDVTDKLASADVIKISFTTENGAVHDYYFIDGKYLVYNDHVYQVRDCESLQNLLADKTLFYINAV